MSVWILLICMDCQLLKMTIVIASCMHEPDGCRWPVQLQLVLYLCQ